MKTTKKIISLLLALCLIASVSVAGMIPAAAETETYAQDTIQGSNILHCFNWSYNNIKAKLPEIAAAGYTAVQTSPVQSPKDYNASWTDTVNQWWKLYQPLGFSVSNGNTWLGTKAQLTSLCSEAENYNIKVIVDVVANHVANNGTDGGTYSYINSGVENQLKNSACYHTNNTRTNDDSRYNITQYHLGMPDLNTANSTVQNRAKNLLRECIDCGVDGFRFDAAKHIELPTDNSSFSSNFWPNVLDDATDYAEEKGVDAPFYYGEILGSAGPNFSISNYTTYMAVTDNQTGDRALDKAFWTAADELADDTYLKGASADKSVLWVESHDTYMGSSGSAWVSNTKDITSEVINMAWAIVGARADSTALFFARPNSTMGAASSDTNWKSTAVTEVNKFKNHFVGTNEALSSSGNVAYIERGTKGVVISKLDGTSGSVSLTAHQMANGTYTDQITGNTFTVSNGTISGTVGSTGIAVVYNANDDALSYISEPTLYLKPNSNWTQASARFAMYVYNSVTGADAWASMTSVSGSNGYYSAAVPSGNWTNVIFVRMNPSSDENRWDAYDDEGHVWNKTNDLFPDTNTNCYTIASGAWTEGDGTWSRYSTSSPTTAPTTTPTAAPTAAPTSAPSNTYTIYAINNANWSKVAVHYWGDGETDWPGTAMTAISGTKVYSFNIPKNVSGIVFTNGASSSTKQTGDITSGIADGAIWTIGSASSNNYPCSAAPDYYLVGAMNNWTNNNNYKFSIQANSSGKLEYKLSGVQLSAGAEFKVHSSSDTWYPSGNNHTVSAAGTYDIYFRPNGDGDSTWLSDSNNSSKRYVYLEDVTPCTVTWQIDANHVLATDSVPKGSAPSYTGDTPTQEPTVGTVYTFTGWKRANDDTLYTDTFPDITSDTTFTAQFSESVRNYTVTWKNYDGTVLETDTAAYGSTPSYDGETPTRPSDGATTYVFSGWSPQITSETKVTGDITYTARFGTNTQTYTITWKDGDGNTLKTESCIQGVTPQYNGDEPTKTADAQYSYTFNNTWDPPLVAADHDTTYTAQFDQIVNKYEITWKDGNGNTLKTDEVEYGETPSYIGTTPTKDADADYTYSFNNTWSPAITSVTQAATYTAQFDATPIPMWTVYATNVIDWTDVFLYYWTDFGDNSWPGVKMTADADNFIMTAQIPANAKGIVFTNGASSNTLQTVNIESGLEDGAHWVILDEKDSTETSKYKVHPVPTYYLVGSMTSWGATGATAFTPVKNANGIEEYKATATLSEGAQIKAYGNDDTWYPDGMENHYTIPADGTYEVCFRPNGDGDSDWHEDVLKVKNVTPYTVTWQDDLGNDLTSDTVIYGDTPAYTGDALTKDPTVQYTYTFSGWKKDGDDTVYTDDLPAVTGDVTYKAYFTRSLREYTITWKDGNNNTLKTEQVAYGTTPAYIGDTPTKADDTEYHYTFSGWTNGVNNYAVDDTLPMVTGEATYTAIFSRSWLSHFTSHSISLDGAIGVNFYIDLGAAATLNYYVTFTCGEETTDPIALELSMYDSTQNAYKVPYHVDVPEMTMDITARLYHTGETDPIDENSFSVAEYGTKRFHLDEELIEGDYYLVGNIGGVDCWGDHVQARYHFKRNQGADGEEYELDNVQLHDGDEIKVIAYHANGTHTWYPSADNYEINADGTYTIWFRPDEYDGDGWYEKHFYVSKDANDLTDLYDLTRATLNLGAKSQLYFNYRTDDLADSAAYLDGPVDFGDVTAAMINARIQGYSQRPASNKKIFESAGLSYYGASLVLNEQTKIKIYYYIDDMDAFNSQKDNFTFAALNGEYTQITPTVVDGGARQLALFEIPGIPAAELDTTYCIKLGDNVYYYSGLDYARQAVNSSKATLQEVGKALYWYNVKADAYFG